jgi:hypothetical protein
MAGYYYRVYIDTTEFGHAFIALYESDGSVEAWGYYPNKNGNIEKIDPISAQILEADGVLKRDDHWGKNNDEWHESDWSSEKTAITKKQYDAMKQHLNDMIESPGYYEYYGNNCTQFVQDMLKIASDGNSWHNAILPLQLKKQLQGDEAAYISGTGSFPHFPPREKTKSPNNKAEGVLDEIVRVGAAAQDAKDMESSIYEKAGKGINEKAEGHGIG